MKEPEPALEELAYIDPDKAGKAHLIHPRYDTTTRCGATTIPLTWTLPAAKVSRYARCPKCWQWQPLPAE